MPKASEVAAELQKLVDALAKNGDVEVADFFVHAFHYENTKQQFLNLIKILPRPLIKDYDDSEYGDVKIKRITPSVSFIATIPRKSVCELVSPARPAMFKCAPLLEEEEIEKASI